VQINRTIPNNKLDITLHDAKTETCKIIDVAISGDRNVIKKEAKKILRYKDFNNRNSMHVECKNKSEIHNNRGNWNHLKIIQTIPEQHARTA
jgi:hypothetical protein